MAQSASAGSMPANSQLAKPDIAKETLPSALTLGSLRLARQLSCRWRAAVARGVAEQMVADGKAEIITDAAPVQTGTVEPPESAMLPRALGRQRRG